MKKTFNISCFVLSAICLFSCSVTHKNQSALVGIWSMKNPSSNLPGIITILEPDGNFYNLGFENGETVITHKGKFKVLSDKTIEHQVTDARFNGSWDLKGNEFINYYELNKDNTNLILSGTVYSKDKRDSLKWTENYQKVQIPK